MTPGLPPGLPRGLPITLLVTALAMVLCGWGTLWAQVRDDEHWVRTGYGHEIGQAAASVATEGQTGDGPRVIRAMPLIGSVTAVPKKEVTARSPATSPVTSTGAWERSWNTGDEVGDRTDAVMPTRTGSVAASGDGGEASASERWSEPVVWRPQARGEVIGRAFGGPDEQAQWQRAAGDDTWEPRDFRGSYRSYQWRIDRYGNVRAVLKPGYWGPEWVEVGGSRISIADSDWRFGQRYVYGRAYGYPWYGSSGWRADGRYPVIYGPAWVQAAWPGYPLDREVLLLPVESPGRVGAGLRIEGAYRGGNVTVEGSLRY